MTMSAPARLIAVRHSIAAWRSSSQPPAAAALTMAYSPLTLYAAIGTSKRARAAATTSRDGGAGLTLITAAPVHHVARRDGVCAGVGVADRGLHEELKRDVVQDLPVLDDAAVAVRR